MADTHPYLLLISRAQTHISRAASLVSIVTYYVKAFYVKEHLRKVFKTF